jgi:hypothetical protein
MFAHFTSEIGKHFVTVIEPNTELSTGQGFNHETVHLNFAFFFCHTQPLVYSLLFEARRLMRRIAFFLSMRRVSLLETNQRLSRIVLRMPLLTIFLRKRLSRESCDSPLRKFTEAISITYFPEKIVHLPQTTHARIK